MVISLPIKRTEVAGVLAKNLSTNFSTDNSSDEFQRIKMLKEKRCLDFSSKNEEEYNLLFFRDCIEAFVTESQRFSHRFGPSRRVFFPRSSAALGRTTVRWIISFVFKRLLEMPSLKKNSS